MNGLWVLVPALLLVDGGFSLVEVLHMDVHIASIVSHHSLQLRAPTFYLTISHRLPLLPIDSPPQARTRVQAPSLRICGSIKSSQVLFSA